MVFTGVSASGKSSLAFGTPYAEAQRRYLNSGCCGMAGSFGYEQGQYEATQACGERVLFPAVRGTPVDDLVVAPGLSCRHQIADFCDDRRSLHTAELMMMAR